jgi:uncharacterized membrane protein
MTQQNPKPPTNKGTEINDPQVEIIRITRAFWLALFGLGLAAILVIVLLLFGIKASNDIVAIVGLFTSVLGTLVGAFFGLQIGSAGKENAEARANQSEQKTASLLGASDENIIKKAQVLFPEAWKK